MRLETLPFEVYEEINTFLKLPDLLRLQSAHPSFARRSPPRSSEKNVCAHALSHPLPAAVARLHVHHVRYAFHTWSTFFSAGTHESSHLRELHIHHSNVPYHFLLNVPAKFPNLSTLILRNCIDLPPDDGHEDAMHLRFQLVHLIRTKLPRLQKLSLARNHLCIQMSQLLHLVRKLEHVDVSYNFLFHDVNFQTTFPPGRSPCRSLNLNYLFFGHHMLKQWLRHTRFPVLEELSVVACADAVVQCLADADADLRSLRKLTLHRDRQLGDLVEKLPNLQYASIGRHWRFDDIPISLLTTKLDVGLSDVAAICPTPTPTRIRRLVLEVFQENPAAVASFLVYKCPELEFLDTSSWSSDQTFVLIQALFSLPKRVGVTCWTTCFLHGHVADAYFLYISECPNIKRIHGVAPCHPRLLEDAFFPPMHYFHGILHLDISRCMLRRHTCKEIFTWLYCGSFRNLQRLDVSFNQDLDDSVFQCFRLPVTHQKFCLRYHYTSATPWSLFEMLRYHPPGAFAQISAMSIDDSLVQIKTVLYALGSGDIRCLPTHLAIPSLVYTAIPPFIVQSLKEHCCELTDFL